MAMGFRVWLGIGGLIVLLIASTAVAVLLIAGLANHHERVDEESLPYAAAVAAAALDAKGVANDERGFLMTGDPRFIDEADRRIASARASFDASMAARADPPRRRAVADARAAFERWVAAIRREFAAYRAGDRSGSITASLGPHRALRKRYEAALSRAQALSAEAIRSADASVATASSRSIAILLTCLGLALVTSLGVGYWLVRSIAVPVSRLLSLLAGGEGFTIIR
jgi:methyl-accepting chemotaxis protein